MLDTQFVDRLQFGYNAQLDRVFGSFGEVQRDRYRGHVWAAQQPARDDGPQPQPFTSPLEVGKALEDTKWKDRYKAMAVNLECHKYSIETAAINKCRKYTIALENAQHRASQTNEKCSLIETKSDLLQNRISELDKELTETANIKNELDSRVNILSAQNKELQLEYSLLKNNYDVLQNSSLSVSTSSNLTLSTLQIQLRQRVEDLIVQRKENEQLKMRIEELESTLRARADVCDRIERQSATSVETFIQRIREVESQLEQEKCAKLKVKEELLRLQEASSNTEKDLASLKDGYNELKVKSSEMASALTRAESECAALSSTNTELRASHEKWKQEAEILHTRIIAQSDSNCQTLHTLLAAKGEDCLRLSSEIAELRKESAETFRSSVENSTKLIVEKESLSHTLVRTEADSRSTFQKYSDTLDRLREVSEDLLDCQSKYDIAVRELKDASTQLSVTKSHCETVEAALQSEKRRADRVSKCLKLLHWNHGKYQVNTTLREGFLQWRLLASQRALGKQESISRSAIVCCKWLRSTATFSSGTRSLVKWALLLKGLQRQCRVRSQTAALNALISKLYGTLTSIQATPEGMFVVRCFKSLYDLIHRQTWGDARFFLQSVGLLIKYSRYACGDTEHAANEDKLSSSWSAEGERLPSVTDPSDGVSPATQIRPRTRINTHTHAELKKPALMRATSHGKAGLQVRRSPADPLPKASTDRGSGAFKTPTIDFGCEVEVPTFSIATSPISMSTKKGKGSNCAGTGNVGLQTAESEDKFSQVVEPPSRVTTASAGTSPRSPSYDFCQFEKIIRKVPSPLVLMDENRPADSSCVTLPERGLASSSGPDPSSALRKKIPLQPQLPTVAETDILDLQLPIPRISDKPPARPESDQDTIVVHSDQKYESLVRPIPYIPSKSAPTEDSKIAPPKFKHFTTLSALNRAARPPTHPPCHGVEGLTIVSF